MRFVLGGYDCVAFSGRKQSRTGRGRRMTHVAEQQKAENI